jgi:hypothetical protein
MELLDPTLIRNIVDYSFGDQSGLGVPDGYIKEANEGNSEFMNRYNEVKKTKKVMTLFIDNIRLYQRPGIRYTAMEMNSAAFRGFKDARVKELSNSDLLALCGKLPDMKFIIFTAFEDTPIDEEIFDKIPDNVLGIHASNSIVFGGKVHPIPLGLQRKLTTTDNRQQILRNYFNSNIIPSNLLYINHNVGNNPERISINNHFSGQRWVTVDNPQGMSENNYNNYLTSILNHKFMICASGNAIGCDCHRDWEVIYMGRVPVVEKSDYVEYLFNGIPVLFVDKFEDITEELLINNDHLFEEIQNFDLNRLDFIKIYNGILNRYND